MQPPCDKTCPRLFVNRLRRPTGTPLTPLALALLPSRLENIRSEELIFVASCFHLGLHAGRQIASRASRRQGPPGSLLCPPGRPSISPTPPLGGCSSGGLIFPQRRLLHCLALERTLLNGEISLPRRDTAWHGPLHLHQPSLLSRFRCPHTRTSFRKCGPRKKN